jgi:GT2 family glycosyltransferase
MTRRRPQVAVIVVGYNSGQWLHSAIGSVLASRGVGEQFDLQAYYVDNGSRDDAVHLVRSNFPNVIVFDVGRNLGFSSGNNLAATAALAAGADYLFLVNPDTRTPEDLVAGLVYFMERWPLYGIVGPLQWTYPSPGASLEPEPNEWSRGALAAGEAHPLAINRPSLRPHDPPMLERAPGTLEHSYVQGAALFARAKMAQQIGLLDPTFHSFYEEVEWCRRARLAGWRVALLTDQGIFHFGGSSGGSYRRRQMMRNKFVFLFTDPSLTIVDMSVVAAGWLRADMRGHGIGGTSNAPTALVDLAFTGAWLMGHVPRMIRMRHRYRQLRVRVQLNT